MQVDELTTQDCLEFGTDDDCEGPVEFRMALSASGRPFPRCDKHWEARLKIQERLNREYPDSPIAPAWFDPTACGERWDED